MIAGVLADRSGRRLTNIAAGIVFAVASLLCAAANSVLDADRRSLPRRLRHRAHVGGRPDVHRRGVASPHSRHLRLAVPARGDGRHPARVHRLRGRWPRRRRGAGCSAWPPCRACSSRSACCSCPRARAGSSSSGRAAETRVRCWCRSTRTAIRTRRWPQLERDLATEGQGAWGDLLRSALRPALIVGIGLAVFQQVTGINAVIYYAPQIFQAAGFTSDVTSLAATTGHRHHQRPRDVHRHLAGRSRGSQAAAHRGRRSGWSRRWPSSGSRFATTPPAGQPAASADHGRLPRGLHRLLRVLARTDRVADDLRDLSRSGTAPRRWPSPPRPTGARTSW